MYQGMKKPKTGGIFGGGYKAAIQQPQSANDYGNMQAGGRQSPFDGMQQQQAYNPMPEQSAKKPSLLPYILAAAEDTIARQMGYEPQGVARLNSLQDEQRALQQQGAILAQQQRHAAMLKAQEMAAQAAKPTARQKEISDFLALPPEEQATYSKALNEITPGSNEPLVINTAYGDIMGTRSQIMQVLRELSASAGGEAPSQAGGLEDKIPPDAIRELIQNPETANFFDEAFGPGMAAQYLGQ